jgi:serine/threonine protein kinase
VTNAGSLNYMAPEIFLRKHVGASAGLDIWSLGCILYALVLGVLPFAGAKSTDVKANITTRRPSFPKDVALSEELRALLEGMLAKEPEERMGMQEIIDQAWIRGRKFTAEEREERGHGAEERPGKEPRMEAVGGKEERPGGVNTPAKGSPKKGVSGGLKKVGEPGEEAGKKGLKGKKN